MRRLEARAEESVERALTRFTLRSAVMRRLTQAVLREQNALRKVTSKRAWVIYLRLESAASARDLELTDAAIRIALRVGRAKPGRR